MAMDENFLVQFILNSLPSEYGPFQMNYNTVKDKWDLHKLHSWFRRRLDLRIKETTPFIM